VEDKLQNMKTLESSLVSVLRVVGGIGLIAGSLYLTSIDNSPNKYENRFVYGFVGLLGAVASARGAIDIFDKEN
jgi:hypothetical protein